MNNTIDNEHGTFHFYPIAFLPQIFYFNRQPVPASCVFINANSRYLGAIEQIIKGCLKNNGRDQKHLYEHYYGYCLKIVFRYISRYDKAVDVVNDGFVKIFRKLDTFRIPEDRQTEMVFMGWIKTIMINTAIDKLRRDSFLPEIGITDEGVWVEDKSATADQSLLYKELIMAVRNLPPAYRTVFNLFVIDGYTHNEIASLLNIAEGTSKSNLSKARAILQQSVTKSEQNTLCRI